MTTVDVVIKSVVDPEWISLCADHNDLFMTGYCGYWICGMEYDRKLGWLVYEFEARGDQPTIRQAKASPEYKEIVALWKRGDTLPQYWHRLDKEMACKAWAEGVKRDGLNWYENGDANSYDAAVQMAMLGELVYG